MTSIRIIRRATRLSAFVLIAAIPLLNLKGINHIVGSLYSLAIGPVWITDPLSGIQVILITLSADRTLLLSMIIPVALAFGLGRVFCGWFCPQNTISELADSLAELAGRRLPLKRFSPRFPSAWPRYAVLALLLIVATLAGFPAANLLSAPGIISVQTSKLLYEGVLGVEIGLIAIIVFFEFFVLRRAWCNYVCPVGGLLGIFRSKKTLKVVFKEDGEHICGRCLECAGVCGLGLNPMEGKIYPLCHNCGECIERCKEIKGRANPLSFRF